MSTNDAQVLEQYLKADEDEDDAAGEFRHGAGPGAEHAAQVEAGDGEDEGDAADEADRGDDVNAEEGEGDAHGQRVDTGGDGQRQHGLDAKGGVELLRRAAGLADHVCADERKQDEGYPVVEAGDESLKAGAEEIADERHERLESAEIKARYQHVPDAEPVHGKALTYGHSAGVHGKAERDRHELEYTHFYPSR